MVLKYYNNKLLSPTAVGCVTAAELSIELNQYFMMFLSCSVHTSLSNSFQLFLTILTGLLQDSPIVRLGMEDRTLMVAEDQRSPMRGSPCLSSSSHSTSLRLCLHSPNLWSGLDRWATLSVELEKEEEKTHSETLLLLEKLK